MVTGNVCQRPHTSQEHPVSTVFYLLGVVYTAAALIVYAYRTSPRPGLSVSRYGYVVVVVGAIGWFVFVPVALALHVLSVFDYVDLSLDRLRVPAPKEERPARPELRAGQLAVLATVPPKLADDETPQRPRHAALRPVTVKPAPAPITVHQDEPTELNEKTCPKCGATVPVRSDGFFMAHSAEDRYCPGSRTKAPTS
jgi:hypothetical protein